MVLWVVCGDAMARMLWPGVGTAAGGGGDAILQTPMPTPHRQRWRIGQRSVLSLAIVHRSEASLGALRASTSSQQGEVGIRVSKVVLILTCCFTVLIKPRAYTAQSRMN